MDAETITAMGDSELRPQTPPVDADYDNIPETLPSSPLSPLVTAHGNIESAWMAAVPHTRSSPTSGAEELAEQMDLSDPSPPHPNTATSPHGDSFQRIADKSQQRFGAFPNMEGWQHDDLPTNKEFREEARAWNAQARASDHHQANLEVFRQSRARDIFQREGYDGTFNDAYSEVLAQEVE